MNFRYSCISPAKLYSDPIFLFDAFRFFGFALGLRNAASHARCAQGLNSCGESSASSGTVQ